jgi:hypothetical protein
MIVPTIQIRCVVLSFSSMIQKKCNQNARIKFRLFIPICNMSRKDVRKHLLEMEKQNPPPLTAGLGIILQLF